MHLLSDLLERFTEVVEEADGYVVPCPAHADSNPSLWLTLRGDKLVLKCRAGCPTPSVVEALGLRMADLFSWEAGAVTVRAGSTGSGPPSEAHVQGLERLVESWEDAWLPREGEREEAWAYARDRFGLSGVQARQLRLGYSPAGFSGPWVRSAWSVSPRLVVPFLGFDGRPHGVQGRALDEGGQRWVGLGNPPGASWARTAVMRQDVGLDYVVVTEGPGDALTAYAAGVDAVAVRGAGLGSNADLMADLAEGLAGQLVAVCGDADEAGQRFQQSLAQGLAAAGLEVVELPLPEGAGDLNEWRMMAPATFASELHGAIRGAGGVSDPGPVELERERAHEPEARADVRVAHDTVASLGGGLRFAPGVGFLHWNGYSWQVDHGKDAPMTRAAVHRQGKAYARLAVEAEEGSAARKGLEGLAARAQASRSVDGILTALKATEGVSVHPERLDSHEHLLAVRNGTVDLRSGKLVESDPEHLLTAALDVDYRPEAAAPRWEAFLEEAACGLDGFAEYLQVATGYGITGSVAEACFLVHLGTGGNGKSVFMGVLEEVLGAITSVTGFGTFEERPGGGATPELAALRGARLVMASEGAANRRLDEAMVKRVTGGERMEVRQLYQEPSTYRPAFLIMLATNHRPGIQGGDEGIWRRVRLVPWQLRLPKAEQDRGLTARLVREEAEGVLAWAVRGAVRWYRDGLVEPACVQDATEAFRESSDELSGFLPGLYHLTDRGRRGKGVSGREVFQRYLEWADEEGVRAWGRKALYNALEERGVGRSTDSGGRPWLHGIEEGPPPAAPDGPKGPRERSNLTEGDSTEVLRTFSTQSDSVKVSAEGPIPVTSGNDRPSGLVSFDDLPGGME